MINIEILWYRPKTGILWGHSVKYSDEIQTCLPCHLQLQMKMFRALRWQMFKPPSHTMQIVCQPCDRAHEMSEIYGIRSLYKDIIVIPDLSGTLLLLHLCCAVKAKWVIALKTSVQRFLSLGKVMALIDDDTLLMKADISLICYHNCFCFHQRNNCSAARFLSMERQSWEIITP